MKRIQGVLEIGPLVFLYVDICGIPLIIRIITMSTKIYGLSRIMVVDIGPRTSQQVSHVDIWIILQLISLIMLLRRT